MRPTVVILGDPDIHVKEGSELVLDCVITNSPQVIPFVSWFYNKEVRSLASNVFSRKLGISALVEQKRGLFFINKIACRELQDTFIISERSSLQRCEC